MIVPRGIQRPALASLGGASRALHRRLRAACLLPLLARRHLLTLAIETSADDSCVAVLETRDSSSAAGGLATNTTTARGGLPTAARLLFNEKLTADNTAWSGIHPKTTAENHTRVLAGLVRRAAAGLPEVDISVEAGRTSLERGQVLYFSEPAGGESPGTTEMTKEAGGKVKVVARRKPDLIAVTRGPGMGANLATGLNTAKGLAVAWGVPLVGVHHMQAHALTPRLVCALERWGERKAAEDRREDGLAPAFPFLSLLVSGGHTLLVRTASATSHAILARADNIAVGDFLDKAGRVILPSRVVAGATDVMYGAALERFAFPHGLEEEEASGGYRYEACETGKLERRLYTSPDGVWSLAPPLSGLTRREGAGRFDFSGLLSHVQRAAAQIDAAAAVAAEEGRLLTEKEIDDDDDVDKPRRELARETMRLAFEHLASRLFMEVPSDPASSSSSPSSSASSAPISGATTLVVSGGVAANGFLREVLRRTLAARGHGRVDVVAPPPELCTDNAAMIAWAGVEMFAGRGLRTELDVIVKTRWSLDEREEGGGVLGADGWVEVET